MTSDETVNPAKGGAPEAAPQKDYAREMGVVECLVAITNQCPSGPVRSVATHALEAIKSGGPGVMREQVYFVLTALQGWRGARARQIHDSLSAFMESRPAMSGKTPSGAGDEGDKGQRQNE